MEVERSDPAPIDLELRLGETDWDALEPAIGLLARSFYEQPQFVDLFPDPQVRFRALPHVFRGLIADASRHGRVDSSYVRGALAGVAVWYPPSGYPMRLGRKLRSLPAMVGMALAAPRSVRRAIRFDAEAERHRPTQPYWYLAAIGVEPTLHRAGVGTLLLRAGLRRVDADGRRCYLETQTLRNVDWYQSQGFELVESEVQFVPDGPPNWTMCRTG